MSNNGPEDDDANAERDFADALEQLISATAAFGPMERLARARALASIAEAMDTEALDDLAARLRGLP